MLCGVHGSGVLGSLQAVAAVNVEAGQFGGYLREEKKKNIFAYIFRSSGLTRSRLCYSYIHKLIHQRPGVPGRGARRTVTGIGRAYTVGIFSRPSRLRTAVGAAQNSRITVYRMVMKGPHEPRL